MGQIVPVGRIPRPGPTAPDDERKGKACALTNSSIDLPHALLGDPLLVPALALRPRAFDECQSRANLLVCQYAVETRHITLIPATNHRSSTSLGDIKKHAVGMVPSMPVSIVRGGWQAARGQSLLPVRLALELNAMARRTVLRVN